MVCSFAFAERVLKSALHALIAGALVMAAGCSTYATYNEADDGAVADATTMVQDVGKNWDVATFDANTIPDFYHTIKHSDVEKLFALIRKKLGPITTLKLEHSRERDIVGTYGTFQEAAFQYEAHFRKGATGEINLVTLDRGTDWKIEQLNVNSNALIN